VKAVEDQYICKIIEKVIWWRPNIRSSLRSYCEVILRAITFWVVS
jgi:hypothetical protein